MPAEIHLCVILLLSVGFQQLAGYPYQTGHNNRKDSWRYPYYNVQLNRSPNQNSIAEASRYDNKQRDKEEWRPRYDYRTSETDNMKKFQAADEAYILDHLAEINAKKTKGEQANWCLNTIIDSEISPQLDINTLERLVSTVNGSAFGRQLTEDTIILPGDGRGVFQSANCYSALHDFFDYYDVRGYEYPSKIWMNKSPCQMAVHIINAKYQDDKVLPTIFIIRIDPYFTTNGLDETIESSKCLVRMKNNGISLQWWDWQQFKVTLNLKTTCQEIIDDNTNTDQFMEKQREVESLLNYVHDIQMVPESVVSNWCPEPLKIAAWKAVNKLNLKFMRRNY